jgi:hypothetical protein
MKELNPSNVTLMASVASFFIQSGGQVFALIAVDRILVEAPPRSFALLQGAHRYDSGPSGARFPSSRSSGLRSVEHNTDLCMASSQTQRRCGKRTWRRSRNRVSAS